MDIVRDLGNVPEGSRHGVIALGNFDGVHRGHREVIATAQARAGELGAPTGVMFFNPHPRRYFSPAGTFFRLTPQSLKLRILSALGVDSAIVVPFDAALAALSPGEFVSQILVGSLAVRYVVAGWDFQFGARRVGNAQVLEQFGAEHGFGVSIVTPLADGTGEAFSSTRVRRLLAKGDPRGAAEILGYHWRLTETVVFGEGRGGGLGFPTINMSLDRGIELAHGIYAVRVRVGVDVYGGAAYHGTRPTYAGTEPFLETFLFDFVGDLYGREVEIEFIDYLRGDRAFADEGALREQIARDCEKARAVIEGVHGEELLTIAPLAGWHFSEMANSTSSV